MNNPIIARELTGLLRSRKSLALIVGVASAFALLVVLRWPTDAQVDLSGAQSRQVFRAFGYGLLATLLLIVPAFPAASLVREKERGTLLLLLTSPLGPASIYLGKLASVLGFALLLLAMSVPGAAACYAMGGISLTGDLLALYGLLALAALQYAALGLLVSSHAQTPDGAVRATYGLVLLLAVVTLGPHLFLQGQEGWRADLAEQARCVSPIPAVMEVLGHADVGAQGLRSGGEVAARYALLAALSTLGMALWTVVRLNSALLDRARPAGVITDERGALGRLFRRLVFLVDPQRRKRGIGPLTNPVMVKEFRCRRFGRLHWMLRLVAGCALLSLGLTYAATTGTMDWDVPTIGGILVVLQVALIALITPSLAAGLISGERESGGWQLLRMTPLSAGAIVRGKLLSVLWPLFLILLATLPGYAVMIYIEPGMELQVRRVMICLLLTAAFALCASAAVSSLFRRTAAATAAAYAILFTFYAGTLLFWLGQDAPFGHSTVQAALTLNPMAAALSVIEAPGFRHYDLVPLNWWLTGGASVLSLGVLAAQTWRLTRPD